MGRFKKGAFHMAMQGGVPIVPIVIRNAGELLWRGSTFIRSGTVDVVVHRPVSVANWTVEDLDDRIEKVRRLFVRTLADWPTELPGGGSDNSGPAIEESRQIPLREGR
jgi:putative phosphoserine phosphatase/1-acylglycerol-3-phosphate O-acyltransferase